jgi:hypothetical protein
MSKQEQYDPFDIVALFNTYLGIVNYAKNTAQRKEQEVIKGKLDEILLKLDKLGGNLDGKN